MSIAKPHDRSLLPRIGCAGIVLALLATHCGAQDAEFFENRIRPLLVDQCYKCHSAQAEKLKGGLLLDTKAGVDQGGDNGPVLVRGEPEKSKLIAAVRWANDDLQMPPKKKLSVGQIADLMAWVKMGAPDPRVASAAKGSTQAYDYDAARKQWAFRPPQPAAVPAVKHVDWPRSPIDSFVLARLEEKGLAPAPPADRRMLIRRVTFDLIGLPPTNDEVEAFVADRSADAFAKVVERLLASPRYGEKWARHWLDLVRYTDSFDSRGIGSVGDARESWRYRDWVVNALNSDLPYHQFVIRQIAGDLLPTDDGKDFNADGLIATGMYAIGNWPGGDADKEKMLTDIVDDQIDVTGRAFLGLTLACARCHDHKFDPIPTADYYSLAGIFFSSHILPGPGKKTDGSPMLQIPMASAAAVARHQEYDTRLAAMQKQVETFADARRVELMQTALPKVDHYLVAVWERRHGNAEPLDRFCAARGLEPIVLERWMDYVGGAMEPVASAPRRRRLLNKSTARVGGIDGVDGWIGEDGRPCPNVVVNANDHPVSVSTVTLPARCVAVHPGSSSAVAVLWTSPVSGTIGVRGRVVDADNHCGDGIAWKVNVISGRRVSELASGAIPNGGAQELSGGAGGERLASVEVRVGDSIELIVDPKAEYTCDTTVVELEVAQIGGEKRVWNLAAEVVPEARSGGEAKRGEWQFSEVLGGRNAALPEGSTLVKWVAASAGAEVSAEGALQAAAVVRDALLAQHAAAEQLKKAGKDPIKEPTAFARPDGKLYLAIIAPRGPFWGEMKEDGSDLPSTARQQLGKLKTELTEMKKVAPPPLQYANGIQEGGTPDSPYASVGDTKIHIRGRYDRLGESVPRRFPRLLAGESQKPITQGSGRLELARWIARADNPLTARVMVNRIWQWHFGEGIVRTPSNYGKLGMPPTHPELLDDLAVRFVKSGWSIKAMHRLILLTAAYQQSSIPDPATLRGDPGNLLFGRFGRRRLEAEELRDGLLAVTDSLDPMLGGPALNDLNTRRRTLYVMTIRSDRSNYRTLFDAADPTAIIDHRIDSTVAPQALFLMNHPFLVAKAEEIARLARERTLDDRGRIEWLYRRLYARQATEREIEIGLRAIGRGWEGYCQILLCANEFVYLD